MRGQLSFCQPIILADTLQYRLCAVPFWVHLNSRCQWNKVITPFCYTCHQVLQEQQIKDKKIDAGLRQLDDWIWNEKTCHVRYIKPAVLLNYRFSRRKRCWYRPSEVAEHHATYAKFNHSLHGRSIQKSLDQNPVCLIAHKWSRRRKIKSQGFYWKTGTHKS